MGLYSRGRNEFGSEIEKIDLTKHLSTGDTTDIPEMGFTNFNDTEAKNLRGLAIWTPRKKMVKFSSLNAVARYASTKTHTDLNVTSYANPLSTPDGLGDMWIVDLSQVKNDEMHTSKRLTTVVLDFVFTNSFFAPGHSQIRRNSNLEIHFT